MANYSINHTCGHTQSVQLYGRNRDREWRISKMEKEDCPDCEAKQLAARRAEESKAALEAAKETGLPELIGSEKQVAWAATIRAEAVKGLLEMQAKMADPANQPQNERQKIGHEILEELIDSTLAQAEARWWIDERVALSQVGQWLQSKVHWAMPAKEVSYDAWKASLNQEEEIEETLLLTPDPASTAPICEVVAAGKMDAQEHARFAAGWGHGAATAHKVGNPAGALVVRGPKDDALNGALKAAGLSWSRENQGYTQHINAESWLGEEHAAELAAVVLAAGFRVRVPSMAVRQRVEQGDWRPVGKRWVRCLAEQKMFSIKWGREEELYAEAKRIPGAKWSKDTHSMLVPRASVADVRDFAETWGFRLTPDAEKLAAEAEAEAANALAVKVALPEPPPQPGKTPAPLTAPENPEIHPDLAEEEGE